ncbi:hypothetical protein IJS77_05700 [bacterium]|nr:hypothetical protein [bacterium]
MENLDLKGALSSIFQKNWWMKFLGLWGISLIPLIPFTIILISVALIGIGVVSKNTPLMVIMCAIGGCLIIASLVGNILLSFFICGYFMLYGNDRAHNKNALYRPIFSKETFKEGLIAGAKSLVAWFVMIPFFILMIPIVIILGVLVTIVTGGSEIGVYAGYLLCLLIFGIPITKIMSYFIKDMDVLSLFHWGKAFEYSKGVKSAIWVTVFPVLACILLAFIGGTNTHMNNVLIVIFNLTLAPFLTYILYAFYFNLLGQYTYAAIKQNEGAEPETIPQKAVNNNSAALIIVVIAVGILLFMMTLGVVAALTIPSLVNRQSNLAALVKMKKAISTYEAATEVYMLENSTSQKQVKDLKDFAGKNCEHLGEYFKIVQKYDDCAFTTADGVYWLFDPEDGSVNISDSADNPKLNVTMGVCQDGRVNCREEFPDVENLLRRTR